jgi:YD repeat-containing protein
MHSAHDDGVLRTVDPLGRRTTMTVDGFGRLLTSQDGRGLTTTLIRDTYGNATTQINSDGGVVVQTFDSLGRVIASTDPLQRTTAHSAESDHPTGAK